MKKTRKVFEAYIVGICVILYVLADISVVSGQLINSQFDGGSAVWNLPDDNNAQVGITVDSSGNEVDIATSANQDTALSSLGAKLGRIETSNNAIQSSVELIRIIDSDNSTSSVLGNSEVFTGTWLDVLGYTSAIINVLTDEDSATNGFEIQSSNNASDITHNHQFTITSNDPLGQHLVFTLVDKYYRIIYTNGTTPQTDFNISASLSKLDTTHSHTHPIEFVVNGNHEAQLTRAILSAKNPGGNYVNVGATGGGNLKMGVEEWANGLAVNSGEQLKVTEFNSVGSELWDSVAHGGFVKITDGSTIPSISENDLHVKIDQAIHSGSNNIGSIEIVDPSDDTRLMVFDNLFKTPVFISIEHHEAHTGEAFTTQAIDESMSDNDELIIAFKTPNTTKMTHLVIDLASKASAHIDLIESPTWSTSTGSQLPVYNVNRNSANTTDLLEDTGGSFLDSNNVILNPSSLSGGTIIPNGHPYAFAATGLGGQTRSRGESEIILASDTTYAIRFTADAGSNAGHIKLRWYEHIPE